MMWKTIGSALEPMVTRAGTAVAGILIGAGIESGHADAIALGLTSAALVGIDLGVRWLMKRSK